MRRMLVTCGLMLVSLVISPYAEYSVPPGLGSFALSAVSSPAQNPRTANAWVQTDQFDYQPGETALIAGGGFMPGEVVMLQVLHANGLNDGSGHEPFSTLTDVDGALSEQWYVHPDDSLHSLFILLAQGLTSGRRASAVFTDAFFFSPDDGGVDDINSNQVDLTRMGTDEAGLPDALGIQFNWDDTSWTGGNTGDACALIDTDDPENGMADFALCVKVTGNPAVWVATSLYSCNDGKTDRCAGPTLVWNTLNGPQPPAGSSSCSASIPLNSDPFTHGKGNVCNGANCSTRDTVAACAVNMNDFGATAATAFLINVCTFPSGEPNSNPFDCVITPDNGFLTIVKAGPPTGDTTAFPFNLGTSQVSQNGTSQWTINGAGSQQNISFRPGTYDLREAIPANWKLDSASCEVSNAGTGTGTTTAVSGPANAGVTGFQILSGRETTCTFTNSKNFAKLTLTKTVVNDNGGIAAPGDFTLKIGTNAVVQGVNQQLDPGSYVLSETGPGGYTAGSWSCTGFSTGGGSLAGSTVTLVAGEDVTCGITNNDRPATLTVIKTVINDNGGQLDSDDFTINVTGPSASPSSFAGSATGTTVTLNAGSYSVDETAVPGYTKNLSAGCSGTLASGGSATCTITNNDNGATLIVIKKVINDNGGTAASSDFAMTINGVTAVGGNSFSGADDPGTSKSLTTVGNYNVTEKGPSGYSASFSTDCTGTIALGQTKTCTITNDDQKASPGGSTVQRAILHDRLVISTGIRRGAGEGALSVTFRLYSDAGCATLVGSAETVNVVFDAPTATSTSGAAQTANGILVSTSGTYYWRATFNGNNFNNEFTTACGSEITQVTFTQ